MKQPQVNITILGVGAMASLFGSRLSGRANVTLLGRWPQQIEQLQRHGLTVTRPDGQQSHHWLHVTNVLERCPMADMVLILVKSYQTERAAREAAKILRPDGLAITLQNGLGNLETLAREVGSARAALGVTAQGAALTEPGHLRHAGEGSTWLAGSAGQQAALERVAALFNRAGLETTVAENADSLVWGKLAVNAGINPLTALLDIPNGALLENETLRQMMATAAGEVAQVAAAQGIRLPFADAAARTAEVSRATAANRSSMLQDVSRAAPTEIEAITGAVVRLGQQLGVPTPVNQRLLRLIRAKESGLVLHSGALGAL
jgi:2-dehydropantoate 2-reductase